MAGRADGPKQSQQHWAMGFESDLAESLLGESRVMAAPQTASLPELKSAFLKAPGGGGGGGA